MRKRDPLSGSGGGQNAKKLCKPPFVKPMWRREAKREREEVEAWDEGTEAKKSNEEKVCGVAYLRCDGAWE